jgi:thymidine kinase
MFSGKTESLIKTAKRFTLANKKILIFKPKMDNRHGDSVICTHDSYATPAISIASFVDVFPHISNKPEGYLSAIFVDEIQFIPKITFSRVKEILKKDINVYFSGLILDYKQEVFYNVVEILPYAHIVYNHSVCMSCGSFDAKYTHRVDPQTKDVFVVGGKDLYMAVCFDCYNTLTT